MKLRYFAYGSNMSRSQMEDRVPGAKFLGLGHLKDHKLVFTGVSKTWGGNGVASIEPAKGHFVYGVVWQVPGEGMEQLSRMEGHREGRSERQNSYERIYVNVVGPERIKGTATTYIKTERNRGGNAPNPPAKRYFCRVFNAAAAEGLDTRGILEGFLDAIRLRAALNVESKGRGKWKAEDVQSVMKRYENELIEVTEEAAYEHEPDLDWPIIDTFREIGKPPPAPKPDPDSDEERGRRAIETLRSLRAQSHDRGLMAIRLERLKKKQDVVDVANTMGSIQIKGRRRGQIEADILDTIYESEKAKREKAKSYRPKGKTITPVDVVHIRKAFQVMEDYELMPYVDSLRLSKGELLKLYKAITGKAFTGSKFAAGHSLVGWLYKHKHDMAGGRQR